MQSLLLLSVLTQVVAGPASSAQSPDAPLSWSDGRRLHKAWPSPHLVSEPNPSDSGRQAILALAPEAQLVVDRPTMRLWRVRDSAELWAKLPALRPAFYERAELVGRLRVPLGLVCDGHRTSTPWREVFSRSSARCLPDFWYPPILK